MKQAKQTAKNNEFLAEAKRTWNAPVYSKLVKLMNSKGEEACKLYLATLSRRWYLACCDEGLLPKGHMLHGLYNVEGNKALMRKLNKPRCSMPTRTR